MLLRRLELLDFRNYRQLDVEPAPGLNLLVGPNAQGKSNLLEAIALVGTGKSFRAERDGDVVRSGCDRAVVRATADARPGEIHLACAIDREGRATRKIFTLNGNSVRYARYLGRLRVVTFVPGDLQLVTGTPAARRAFLNRALSQSEPRYYHELARYRRALQQRNALLKNAETLDEDLLEIYGRTLLESGTQIMLARSSMISALQPEAAHAHGRFAPGERLEIRYEPNCPFQSTTPHDVTAALRARLAESADQERARGATVVGPHRDDVALFLDGVSLQAYGSQGQQRTAVLALKVAEYSVMRERTDDAPVLLLDDVLSELDEARASAFLGEMGAYEQAFVTATHLPKDLAAAGRIARISGGAMEWIAC
ncbi:MAG: DNA replication/repair protein RecF [Candidatus Eremiobacteraeota bacterium]|nr:DNA replication/repair protein RecF [Candidatus Eremiobacteraeota bacterium]